MPTCGSLLPAAARLFRPTDPLRFTSYINARLSELLSAAKWDDRFPGLPVEGFVS